MNAKRSLSVVVPVYNEEVDVPRNIPKLYEFLKKAFKNYSWELVVADNGPSTDKTAQIAQKLARGHKEIRYVLVNKPGRGGALREVFGKSNAHFLAYMDVDLSSDLHYLPRLIEELEKGADIAIGSRLSPGARVYGRTLTREIMSRGYNLLIKFLFWTKFNDAQCGFKAMRQDAARKLLPIIEDRAWFFDSELLIIAQKAGYKISEIPIVWRDDPRSTVKVAKTATGDIKGLLRLFVTKPWRRVGK